jgi:hypothetical protein
VALPTFLSLLSTLAASSFPSHLSFPIINAGRLFFSLPQAKRGVDCLTTTDLSLKLGTTTTSTRSYIRNSSSSLCLGMSQYPQDRSAGSLTAPCRCFSCVHVGYPSIFYLPPLGGIEFEFLKRFLCTSPPLSKAFFYPPPSVLGDRHIFFILFYQTISLSLSPFNREAPRLELWPAPDASTALLPGHRRLRVGPVTFPPQHIDFSAWFFLLKRPNQASSSAVPGVHDPLLIKSLIIASTYLLLLY